jgi:hypothetical protein
MIKTLQTSQFGIRSLFNFAGTLLCFAPTSLLAAQSVEFKREEPLSQRVETRIEVKGELKLLNPAENSPDELKDKAKQAITRLPMTVAAQLRYQKRALAPKQGKQLNHGLRKYEIATAQIQVGKGDVKNELSAERRLIVVHDTTEATSIFSPSGPLVRDELDLLSNAADAGLLVHLLPEQAKAVGETWQPSTDVLARLLRLEIVNESTVTLTFNRIENNVAILDLAGKVSGGIEGIASDIELVAKLNYDLTSEQCTWFAGSFKENRAATQGSPGYETTSRIRVSLEPCNLSDDLADTAVAKLKVNPDAATKLLRYASKQHGYEFVYEPHWHVVSDQPDLVVLRNLDRGELVAQCNLSTLAPLGKGEQLTLEGYQLHLKKSLSTSFREFIEAGESVNESGIRVLRVVATGSISDVPLHWVFYHLSDDQGHRVTLAFTMDAENAPKFGRAEETLISSFYFTGNTETAQKTTSKTVK